MGAGDCNESCFIIAAICYVREKNMAVPQFLQETDFGDVTLTLVKIVCSYIILSVFLTSTKTLHSSPTA